MSVKRKISIRKLLQTTITLVAVIGCTVAILSAADIQDKRTLKGIDIGIKNEQFQFIDKQEVKQMLYANHINIAKTNVSTLNARKMEQAINANPWVADAQVYVDNARILHVFLTQRVPVVRLFDQSGSSYYLDGTLKSMPLSDKYIHYTTVVTNVPVFANDSIATAIKGQIVDLVRFVERDSFWRAQISQIIITDDKTFELVPVLGNQRIILGDTSEMKNKFDNLFSFYKKVLDRVGWEKYDRIDLRFSGQVVASPALAWKIPVDKALTNMNWVKSIIGNEQPVTIPDAPATAPDSTITGLPQTIIIDNKQPQQGITNKPAAKPTIKTQRKK